MPNNNPSTKWSTSPLVWRCGEVENISCVFTWDLPEAVRIYKQGSIGIKKKFIGGPATKMFPEYFNNNKEILTECNQYMGEILTKYNVNATRTSIGCPNRCGFCAVSRIHPDFREINNFIPGSIICDDNFLACSEKHFNKVIDSLKRFDYIDFNQGLDASLLDIRKANRLAELNNPMIRLAWDNTDHEKSIIMAITNLRKAGIPRNNIRCYVLIGFNDTPGDALYRLEILRHGLGIKPNPMRYQPFTGIHALTKNSYVHPNWTNKELDRFMSYWSNLRFVGGVPFSEYEHNKKI